jgi:hypothetical protein
MADVTITDLPNEQVDNFNANPVVIVLEGNVISTNYNNFFGVLVRTGTDPEA